MSDSNNPLPDSADSFRPPALDQSGAFHDKPPEPPLPQSQATVAPTPAELTAEDKQMGMLCHLLGVLLGFVGPLIIWLIKKDQSKFVDSQGKEALNFHLTLLIGHVIGAATSCVTLGIINMVLWVVGLVFGIMGTIEANKGNEYRYPFAIRMIK